MPPVHPDEISKILFMDNLCVDVKQMAQSLDVSPKTVSAIINGHQGISVEMALRLSKALNTSSDVWINLQRDYDIWKAREVVNLDKVIQIVPNKKKLHSDKLEFKH